MLKLTHISRLSDGLTLCALLEDDKDQSLQQYREQRKKIINELAMSHAHRRAVAGAGTQHYHPPTAMPPSFPSSSSSATTGTTSAPAAAEKMTIESGRYNFHILLDAGVCYMVLCDRQYSTQLAHSYLEDLRKEFSQLYGREVEMVEKNYAFIKFDTYIHKTMRVYSDTRTKRNVKQLRDELGDVHQIMRKNIEEIVGRKEKLNSMVNMSNDLSIGTGKLKLGATRLNRMYFWRTYGPIVVVLGIVFLLLLVRYLLF